MVKHLGTCDLSGLWLQAEPNNQNFARPGQNSEIFVFQKTHMFCKKKFSRPVSRFLTNFEVKLVAI